MVINIYSFLSKNILKLKLDMPMNKHIYVCIIALYVMIGDIYNIKFILPNIGEAEGELIRIKGPHLTELMNRELPINSRGLKREDLFLIPVSFIYAVEKPTNTAKRGDIVFEPKSRAIIVILADRKFDSKIAVIGSVVKNLKIFDKLTQSSGVRIESLNE